MPSCQRKLASRIGLTADAFQSLDSGFRRNDDLKVPFGSGKNPQEKIRENPGRKSGTDLFSWPS
jgi:hypothetical protein